MARQRPTVGNGAMHNVNRCRNEEIIVKGNFGWAWPMWAGRPRVGNGAMHNVQYQFEVNRCRNEEIIVKGNFGWVWSMWRGQCGRGTPGLVMGPCIVEIIRIAIREVQYQFEDIQCSMFQGSSALSVGGESGQDGRTTEIITISPLFSEKRGDDEA
ncbi:hypothetical protein DPMN_161985 [Dreissena polymorpha]|uniref:Uncharacterized protein n=1 Tax=Dreissena polymorpha TaxID=45954 RepID=A0A9D4EU08_DREPO|nr:hypothetical protein DPMN_161985 [Dreissena polymorpha]